MGYFQSLSYSSVLELAGLSGHFYRLYSSNHPLLCGFDWCGNVSRTLNFQIWRHSLADLPDFFLCEYLKSEVYVICPSCIQELKYHIMQRITRNWLGLITVSYTRLSHTVPGWSAVDATWYISFSNANVSCSHSSSSPGISSNILINTQTAVTVFLSSLQQQHNAKCQIVCPIFILVTVITGNHH